MSKFFERQIWHLLAAILLLIIAREGTSSPDTMSGQLWGIPTATWYWASIWSTIAHQLYVMLVWRSQLHFGWVTRTFGNRGFDLYARGFALVSFARFFTLIALAFSNRGTLAGPVSLFNSLSFIIIVLTIYLIYSVLRYFSIHRALGADHFEERYREMGLVKGGIFNYVRNGMYLVGLLALWLPGLFLASKAALLAGLLGHAYIWVHYFTTEKPDMIHIYGDVAR